MKLINATRSALLLATLSVPVFAAPPTTTPAASRPSMNQAQADLRAKLRAMQKTIDANADALSRAAPAEVLRDPQKRKAAAPAVIALLEEKWRLMAEYTRYTPRPIDYKESIRIEAMLYLFEDPKTVARIDAMVADNAPAAEAVKLHAQWIAAAGDAEMQKAVAAAADVAGAKYPADKALTTRVVSFVSQSANLAVRNELLHTCTVTMKNLVADQIIAELKQTKARQSMQEAAEKQLALVGKPMTVAGTRVDGKAFSTESLKGKVVLIDFWATWCGPCKAELPHVKALYEQYKGQGFEIVGVSGDESAAPLVKYVAEQNLGWIHLFDTAAAEKGEMSALMKQFNVAALPTMFLIDRDGVCRSVTARNELDTMIPKLLAEKPAPATAPATQPNPDQAMLDDVSAFQKAFQPTMLADAKAREASTAAVVPAARKVLADLIEMGNARPASAAAYRGGIIFYATVLAVYGDADGQGWLDAMANDSNPRTALLGKTQQLYVRWCRSTEDAAAQAGVVDEIETLAKANPMSQLLTHQIVKMVDQGAAEPALADRLKKLVAGSMKNAEATKAATKLSLPDRVGKPMALAGTTVEGKAFTSADWKGKVVLVDFWAVWCGPCKKETPRIKALYDQYHGKCLEVLGVSNDYEAEPVKKYAAENSLPWPQLYDAAAAGRQAMHPLTSGFGIDAIPVMFLIDKQGVCRSVTARESLELLIPKLLAE